MRIAVVIIVMKAALIAALLVPALAAATPVGVLTIVEGDVVVIRDALKFAAVEGLRLRADDIVHSADNAGLARIEWSEGGALDIGPGTRLLLRPTAFSARSERPASLYLMQGSIKLSTPAGTDAPGFATARLDMPAFEGVVVALVADELSAAFVETGAGDIVERRRDGSAAPLQRLAAGQGYLERGGEPGLVMPRPPQELLKRMPRAFADSLPLRARRFAALPVQPASTTDIEYDDIAPWIDHADAELRPLLRQRWAAKAREPVFRAALLADLRSHPEWARLVLPPKKRAIRRPPPATSNVARVIEPALPMLPVRPAMLVEPISRVVLPPSTPVATVTVK